MYRSIAAGIALLLPAIAAFPAQKPVAKDERVGEAVGRHQLRTIPVNNPRRPAADGQFVTMKLAMSWSRCIARRPRMARPKKTRSTTRSVHGESRELGCEISDDGHQTLTLVRAIF